MRARKSYGSAITRAVAWGLLAGTALTSIVAAGSRGASIKVTARVESPKIIAVRVRHDLCPICKSLDPRFDKIVEETKGSVLFVTLDLTSESSQRQAALLVGALGLESVWTGDLTKLGSVTLLDGQSKKMLSFVQTDDIEVIRSSLREATGASGN